jgi:hypothetical protein
MKYKILSSSRISGLSFVPESETNALHPGTGASYLVCLKMAEQESGKNKCLLNSDFFRLLRLNNIPGSESVLFFLPDPEPNLFMLISKF